MGEQHLRALCYSDIFEYPLTRSEIVNYQISTAKPQQYKSGINKIHSTHIQESDGYYFLTGRERIVALRKKRAKWTGSKWQLAKRRTQFLQLIPTIELIAVTGAVAAGNASEDDDIDLLVITKSGWLWTTRLVAVLVSDLFRIRRKPGDTDVKDKLCLNMFVDEDHLQVPQKEQDIFSANEIVRMKVLWSRGEVVRRFYSQNMWVKTYLPNFKPSLVVQLRPEADLHQRRTGLWPEPLADAGHDKKNVHQGGPLQFIELFIRTMQLRYMRPRRTKEVIQNGYLRFHPHDARTWIMKEYQKRLRRFGLE